MHYDYPAGKAYGNAHHYPERELGPQKEPKDDHDKECTLKQGAPHGLETGLEADGPVGVSAKNDAFRETVPGVGNVFSDLTGNLQCVFIAGATHIDAHGRSTVVFRDEFLLVVGIGNSRGDLTEGELGAIRGANRDRGEFVEAIGLPAGADVESAGGSINGPGRKVDRGLPDSVGHGIRGQVVSLKFFSVELDGNTVISREESAYAADSVDGQ